MIEFKLQKMSSSVYPQLPDGENSSNASDITVRFVPPGKDDRNDVDCDGVIQLELEPILQEPEHPYKDPLEANTLLDQEKEKSGKPPPRAKRKSKDEKAVVSKMSSKTMIGGSGLPVKNRSDDEEIKRFIPSNTSDENGKKKSSITDVVSGIGKCTKVKYVKRFL